MVAQQPSAGWARRDRTELSEENADFAAFMTATWASMFRTAYLLTGDYQLAEDVVQTAFAKVYLTWSRISKLEHPTAYTRKIVTSHAMSWWRRKSSAEVPMQDLPGGHLAGHEDRITQARAVWSALATLSSMQRVVMLLRYYEDLSEAENSEILNICCDLVNDKSSAARTLISNLLVFYVDEVYN